MVFLIQRMQKGPSNRLIDVEDLNEDELEILSSYFRRLSTMAKKEKDLSQSHSINRKLARIKI